MVACVAAGLSALGWPIASRAAAAERGWGVDHTPAAAGAAAKREQTSKEASKETANHARNDARDAAALAGVRALAAGYERAPALLIALCAFVVLPALALISLLVQWMAAYEGRQAAIRAAERRTGEAEPVANMPFADEMPLWPGEAWLTVDGPRRNGPGELEREWEREWPREWGRSKDLAARQPAHSHRSRWG
jgi:hypothetical protein